MLCRMRWARLALAVVLLAMGAGKLSYVGGYALALRAFGVIPDGALHARAIDEGDGGAPGGDARAEAAAVVITIELGADANDLGGLSVGELGAPVLVPVFVDADHRRRRQVDVDLDAIGRPAHGVDAPRG